MKQLNNKQLKEIKAGAVSGAVLSGIGAIIKGVAGIAKPMFEYPINIINSIAGWAYAFSEGRKGHVKMTAKVGFSEISFDDTSKVEAAQKVAIEQLKHGSVSPKDSHMALQPLPSIHNLTQEIDVSAHDMYDHSYAIDDGFMHF